MKFKEEAKVKMKEIEKKIDTEQNRVIINKTMRSDSVKKTKENVQQTGWLKNYIGRLNKDKED